MTADNKRTIIVIGAGLLSVKNIETAQKMGYQVIVTDMNPDAIGFKYSDIPVLLSTRDVEGHVREAKKLSNNHNIVGVFTAGADVEVTVAHTARALGLIGVSPEVANKCNDKLLMRQELAKANIPGPRFAKVNDKEDALRFIKEVGYPVIIKPIDNCGSRGVKVISNDAELDLSIEFSKELGVCERESLLIEEFLEGPTQTVEMLVCDGKYHLCSIIDTFHDYFPYRVEVAHVNPTILSKDLQDELFELAKRASEVIGIDVGAAKVDTIISGKEGPVVMEMTSRLSGGFHCQYTTPLAHGTNNIKAAIDIAVGNPVKYADIVSSQKRHARCQALFPKPGKVVSINGVEKAKMVPGVEEVFILVNEGDLVPEYRSSADRVCFVITSGASYEEALRIAKQAKSLINIETIR